MNSKERSRRPRRLWNDAIDDGSDCRSMVLAGEVLGDAGLEEDVSGGKHRSSLVQEIRRRR